MHWLLLGVTSCAAHVTSKPPPKDSPRLFRVRRYRSLLTSIINTRWRLPQWMQVFMDYASIPATFESQNIFALLQARRAIATFQFASALTVDHLTPNSTNDTADSLLAPWSSQRCANLLIFKKLILTSSRFLSRQAMSR